jgi:hypothetical protein
MSDHDNHQKRQRSSHGSGNPHPSTATPSMPAYHGSNTPRIRLKDLVEIRAAWLELHDIGLVALRFPRRWRCAVAVVLRMMVAETECAACRFECREPGNLECCLLRDKLPKVPKCDLPIDTP